MVVADFGVSGSLGAYSDKMKTVIGTVGGISGVFLMVVAIFFGT
jgi:hypothetical protein